MITKLGRPMGVLVGVLVVCFLVVIVALAATVLYVREANAKRVDTAVATCLRGNDARSRINEHDLVLGLHNPPLPILDCKTVIH